MQNSNSPSLLMAYLLDGQGHAKPLTLEKLDTLEKKPGQTLWLHWDKEHPHTLSWLKRCPWVNRFERHALLEKNTRPRRIQTADETLLMFWRIMYPDSHANTQEFLSVRLFVRQGLLLSFAQADADPGQGLPVLFHEGRGPKNVTELLFTLIELNMERSNNAIETLVNQIDTQENMLTDPAHQPNGELHMFKLRHSMANLRRHLAPMLDLFKGLGSRQPPWFEASLSGHWNEISNHLTRNLEELDLCRERIGFVLDVQERRQSLRMGRIMYLLTVVTAFFLPLSFVTGLLGTNLGGIPGNNTSYGFLAACLLLSFLAVIQYSLLRWLRWL